MEKILPLTLRERVGGGASSDVYAVLPQRQGRISSTAQMCECSRDAAQEPHAVLVIAS